MTGFRWFNRHARWGRQLDSFVDAELPERERALFDAHLQQCESCASQVREATALKRMLSEELTEHPTPRSFRLTPAMVAGTPAQQPAANAPWWPRAAQAVGGLAVAAFAFLIVVDLSGTSNNSVSVQSAAGADDAARFESAPLATSAADTLTDGSDGSESAVTDPELPSSPALAPEDGDTEIGKSGDDVELSGANDGGTVTDETDAPGEDTAGDSGPGAPAGGLEIANQPGDSGLDALLLAQIASIVVALVAGIAYLASRRTKQE